MVELANVIWADGPGPNPSQPQKSQIRKWGTYLENLHLGSGLVYTFSAVTADADPGVGLFRLNNATVSSATAAYLDDMDGTGIDVGAIIDDWDNSANAVKGALTIRGVTNPEVVRAFNITGSVVNGAGYRKLNIAYIGGAGSLVDGDDYTFVFNRSGDPGAVNTIAPGLGVSVNSADPVNPVVGISTAYDASKVSMQRTDAPALSGTWEYGGGAAVLYGSIHRASFAASGAKPIFGRADLFATNFGAGTVPYQVGYALALAGTVGCGNLYAFNPIAQMGAGAGNQAFTTVELNANNFNIHYGDSQGQNDPSNGAVPWGTIMNLIGSGDHRFMTALSISAPSAAGQLYNRGVSVAGNCIRLQDFEAASNAPTGLRVTGTRSGAAIDASGASVGISLLTPNNSSISSLNSSSAVAEILKLNAGNALIVGAGASGGISMAQNTVPSSDNTWDLGVASTGRWKTIYLVNSPSVTSDPSLKENIEPLDPAKVGAFVDRLESISWRWTIGGTEEYEEEEDGLVPLMETVIVTKTVTEMVDGRMVEREVTESISQQVMEDRPVFDADGAPVMWQPVDHKTGKPLIDPDTQEPMLDADGNPVLDEKTGLAKIDPASGVPYAPRQKMVSAVVMVPGKVKVKKTRDVPGKRVHAGWNAEEVKAILDDLGVDWGIVVKDAATGILSLREGRMTAILWSYTRDLSRRVAALEAMSQAR